MCKKSKSPDATLGGIRCGGLIYLFSFVSLLNLVVTNVAQAADPSALACYTFEDGTAVNVGGSAGSAADGTLQGGASIIYDAGGNGKKESYVLDVTGSPQYVNCGGGNGGWGDIPQSELTIAAWYKARDIPPDNFASIACKGDGETGVGGYSLSSHSRSANVTFTCMSVGGWEGLESTNANAWDGQWHHVAGVYISGVGAEIYVDGVLSDSASTGATGINLNQWDFVIGGNGEEIGLGTGWRHSNGLIDDVCVFDQALSVAEIQQIMKGVGVSSKTKASDPYPADGATDVPRDVVLSWTAGVYAAPTNGHKVYLSENINDVDDGIGGITQSVTNYARPQRLDFNTIYYWRVDEVNAPPTSHIEFKGEVWQFTTEPFTYPIENITATASSTHQADTGAENTINGFGLDTNDLHSVEPADMWLSGDEPNGAWIEYEFDNVYKLHEMWVWNSNGMMESFLGFGLKDVTIEYSTNGTDYTTLGTTHEFARAPAPGMPDYAHNTTIDFEGAAAKFVRFTANSNWGGMLDQYGLSEVRFFYIPVLAREPSPDSGTTDVAVDVTLGFRAGREGAEHNLYLSSDEQAVIDGNAPVTTVTENSYGPLSLDLGTTYYWKINEVNEAETPTTWQGEIWNFSTPELFIVDDFEDYNDYPPDEIWSTWVDGYDVPANGATVGYPAPDFLTGENYAETAIVHGGDQSMPFFYSNTGTATYSEGERTFAVPQNWAKAGVQTLALYFHGTVGNTGQLYVKVNGSKVVYPGDAGDIARLRWKQWNIDLASLGLNLQSVTTLAIGIDGNGATGTLYLDDIRLYRLAPEVVVSSEEIWIEAEAANTITDPMKTYDDPLASGGKYIGTDDGIGDENDAAPADGVATYNFTAQGGTYKIEFRAIITGGSNSFWVRIPSATDLTPGEDPGQPGSGWVRFNDISDGAAWHWDEVHSSDHSDAVANWTLAAGANTLEIARREDGTLLDIIVISKID